MDWLAAQENDGEFISDHARNIPFQEDIAETFLVHLAVDHRRDRISQALFDTVVQTVPNRLAYFRAQPFDLYPVTYRRLARVLSLNFESDSIA